MSALLEAKDTASRRLNRVDLIWLGAALAALACIILLSVSDWRAVGRANLRDSDVRRVVGRLRVLQIWLNEAETGQRGYLLTGEQRYLEPYNKATHFIPDSLRALQSDLSALGFGSQASRLGDAVKRKMDELAATIELRRSKGFEAALAVVRTDRGLRDMQIASSIDSSLENQLSHDADALSEKVESGARSAAIMTSAACILLFILFAVSNLQLRRQRESANQANRAKSAFLATMSHELRTPLNAIIGYSEMLTEEAEDFGSPQLTTDLNKIQVAGRHLLMLINSILDLSKVESGKMELFIESFPVSALIADVVAVIQPLAQRNNNRFEVLASGDLGVIQADQTKLRQSLYNLLSNACKFTKNGTVTLGVHRDNRGTSRDTITFDVSDTGIGLTKEQIRNIFEPFTQADQSTSRRFGGSGLGLALTRTFVRMMDGEISVASEPQLGSTFTVCIPAIHSSNSLLANVAPGNGVGAGDSVLLAIDDDPSIHELLTRALAKTAFRIVSAYTGEEGIRLARKLRPVAVTLDVMMPGMDGWATLSALKADPELSEIPVIMLTITDNKNLGYMLGANDYLIKPIDREKLISILVRYRRTLSAASALIIEDDPDTRILLRRALESEGWRTSEASNGREGLECLAQSLPGVILLDLMMPEMDGFEFVAQVRQQPEARSIPIIVLTAKDLTAEDRQRLNGGVTKVIQKGAMPTEEILREVSALVTARVKTRNTN